MSCHVRVVKQPVSYDTGYEYVHDITKQLQQKKLFIIREMHMHFMMCILAHFRSLSGQRSVQTHTQSKMCEMILGLNQGCTQSKTYKPIL